MIRYHSSLCLEAAVLIVFVPSFGWAQSAGSAEWADYASDDYEVVPNITYNTANNTELKLDLYRPKNSHAPTPTIMYIHGGGWVRGTKERNVLRVLPYLALGWAVVNVEYRLAGNSLTPAAVEDCRCALRWIVQHAAEYNFDTARIVITGSSAGGHLALMTGMLPESTVFDRQCPNNRTVRREGVTEQPLKVAAIINWYGITDVGDLLSGPNVRDYAIEWFGSMKNREELASEVSPIHYVRVGLPPILTIHGDADPIVPYTQATRLHEALDKVGVPNELVTIQGGKHGDFSRQETVKSYSALREFLRKFNLLKVE